METSQARGPTAPLSFCRFCQFCSASASLPVCFQHSLRETKPRLSIEPHEPLNKMCLALVAASCARAHSTQILSALHWGGLLASVSIFSISRSCRRK